jgi:hypothetical protein
MTFVAVHSDIVEDDPGLEMGAVKPRPPPVTLCEWLLKRLRAIKETVPVVANGGIGDTTGIVPFGEERLVRLAHPIRDTCDAGHTLR